MYRRTTRYDALCGEDVFKIERIGHIKGIAALPDIFYDRLQKEWGEALFPVVIDYHWVGAERTNVIRYEEGDKYGFFSHKWKLGWIEAWNK